MGQTPITLHDNPGERAARDTLNKQQQLKELHDDLEAAGHTVVDSALQSPTEARIAFEADSAEARDLAVRDVVCEWRARIDEQDAARFESITAEIQRAVGGGAVVFTIRRGWLPDAAPDDAPAAWDEMVGRINGTHEVIEDE